MWALYRAGVDALIVQDMGIAGTRTFRPSLCMPVRRWTTVRRRR